MNSDKLFNMLSTNSITDLLDEITSDDLYAINKITCWSTDGYAIRFAKDGKTAIVGAPYENFKAGCAYIFELTPSGWVYSDKLQVPKDQAIESFGCDVDVCYDGNVAAVAGTLANKETGSKEPIACVYSKDDDGWKMLDHITDSKPFLGSFPPSIFLSSTGKSLTFNDGKVYNINI